MGDTLRQVVEPLFCAAHAQPRGNLSKNENLDGGGANGSARASVQGHDVLVSRLGYRAAKRREVRLIQRRCLLDALVKAFHRARPAFFAAASPEGRPARLSLATACIWRDDASGWLELVESAERLLKHDGRLQRETLVPHMLRVGVLQTGVCVLFEKCF